MVRHDPEAESRLKARGSPDRWSGADLGWNLGFLVPFVPVTASGIRVRAGEAGRY
jgi:hypothetical protein